MNRLRTVGCVLAAAVMVALSLDGLVSPAEAAMDEASTRSKRGSARDLPPLPSAAPKRIAPRVAPGTFELDPSRPASDSNRLPPRAPFDPAKAWIDEARTTETSIEYVNPDGSRTSQVATSAVRFKDSGGAWRDLDPAPVDRGDVFAGSSMPPGFSLGKGIAGDIAAAPIKGGQVKLRHPDARQEADAGPPDRRGVVGPMPGGGKDAKGARGVVFDRALPGGRSVSVGLTREGFEETVTVPSRHQSPSYTAVLSVPVGLTARAGGPGIELVDEAGEVLGTFGGGSAWDSSSRPDASLTEVRTTLVGQEGADVTVQVAVADRWWSDPARVFPVFIDPVYQQTPNASGGLDTFVMSNMTVPQSTQPELRLGNNTSAVARTLMRWNLASLASPQRRAVSASLAVGNNVSWSCQARPVNVLEIGSGWSANTVWSNQPAYGNLVTSESFAHGGTAACPPAYASFNLTALANTWISGGPNHGLALIAGNENDQYGWKKFASSDTPYAPVLTIDWDTLPPNSTPQGPGNDSASAIVSSTTPELQATPVVDPDGDPVKYWFTVGTSANPSATPVFSSGWMSSAAVRVPEGVLQNGTQYWWTVMTWDGRVWPSPPPPPLGLKVDLRLGSKGSEPIDTHGPVAVNLANGNVYTEFGSPPMPTVGGSVGLKFSYNSQEPANSGLTASYYDFSATGLHPSPDIQPGDTPQIVVQDSMVNFSWESGAPHPQMAADHFTVRWKGFVAVPVTGAYEFGAYHDDGVRIRIDNNLVLDRWGSVGGVHYGTPVTLVAGMQVPIQVDYFENTGGAAMQLYARAPTASPSVAEQVVPASWLSTTSSALPGGWRLSVDLEGDEAFSRADIKPGSVALTDSTGAVHTYTSTNGGWKAPEGEDSVLSSTPSGGVALQTGGGTSYAFDAAGNLVSAVSGLDDRQPAAAQHTWGEISPGGPFRLRSIIDPVSGGSVAALHYWGDGTNNCATPPAGFDTSAAPGLLCGVVYWSTDPSNPAVREATNVFYLNKQLARVVDPGGETTDFGYDGDAHLTMVREPLQADWVAANPAHVGASTVLTSITYCGSVGGPPSSSACPLGRAAAVRLAAPDPAQGEARPQHWFTYGAGSTDVQVAGNAEPNGFTSRLTYNALGQTISVADPVNPSAKTITQYDAADNLVATTDPAGRRTTTIYDRSSNPTDVYGPAPSSCFGADNRPAGACAIAVAHTSTRYDEGLVGLQATWWNNAAFAGAPLIHALGAGAKVGSTWDADAPTNGFMDVNFGSARPAGFAPNGDVSIRYTGEIDLPQVGTYTFVLPNDAGNTGYASVQIDDAPVVAGSVSSWPSGTYQNSVAGKHRITVAFNSTRDANNTVQPAGFYLRYVTPGTTPWISPASLSPRYGLSTSTTTDDSSPGAPAERTRVEYALPGNGLATKEVQDPGGLDLATITDHGVRGDGNFYRQRSQTLPAGGAAATTTDQYYDNNETATVPADCGVASGRSFNQRGGLKTTTNPDGRIERQIRDDAGRTVAGRIDGDAGWVCTSYDARGRVAAIRYPDGRTVTHDYAVGGDPLRSSVSDAVGTVSSAVDLLGRIVSYTDVWGKNSTTTYDVAGRATATSGPAGRTSSSYDAGSRLHELRWDDAVVATPSYDPATLEVTGAGYPGGAGNGGNGTTSSVTRDAAGRIASVGFANGATQITRDEVTRSQSGKVLSARIDGAPDPSVSYTYDPVGRLTGAVLAGVPTAGSSAHTLAYSYAGGAAPGCVGAVADSGLSSNRQSATFDGTTTNYCYGPGDRLLSTNGASPSGTIAYDPHGNTVSLGGQTYVYDVADRHTATVAGARVDYLRDATNRIVERKVEGVTVARYSYSGGADTPDAVLDGSGAVVERVLALPGDVVVTRRAAGGDTWSYPNVHGDVAATADQSGTKVGPTFVSDPFGNNLTGSNEMPENAVGELDNGWLGSKQRMTEHQPGVVPIVQMGARPYHPGLGRFLSVDPVRGGSANSYDYVDQDPVNAFDLDGTISWKGAKKWAKARGQNLVSGLKAGLNNSYIRSSLTVGAAVGLCGTGFGCLIVGGAAIGAVVGATNGVANRKRGGYVAGLRRGAMDGARSGAIAGAWKRAAGPAATGVGFGSFRRSVPGAVIIASIVKRLFR
jgi:RHS repeat-associated protein